MDEAQKMENVIKGLECCNALHNGGTVMCGTECPYGIADGIDRGCRYKLIPDALALIKAQEPVEPVMDIDTWKCGNCGHTLEHQELLGENVLFHEQYNYCPDCGRAVKWK